MGTQCGGNDAVECPVGQEARQAGDQCGIAADGVASALLAPIDKLRAALIALITVSRQQPHLYQLMFSTPAGDPAAVVRAAQRSCDEFLAIVADVAGAQNAQRYAAILLTGAHGAAGLELSGLLHTDKWHTTAEELIDTLLAVVAEPDRRD